MFRKSIFVQTVFWRGLFAISSILVSLLTLRLFSKHFSLEYAGLLMVALLVMGCLPVFDGGFRTAISRRMLAQGGSGSSRDDWLRFGQRLYARFGLIIFAVGIVVMVAYSFTPNARTLDLPILFYISLGSTGALIVVGYAYLQQLTGIGLQRRSFVVQSFMAWISVGLLWGALKAGLGVWSFVFSMAGPQFAAIAIGFYSIKAVSPSLRFLDLAWDETDSNRFQELRSEASGVMQMQFWTLLLYASDAILVGWIWTGPQVGRFALAATLFSKLRSVLQSADEAVWPILAAKNAKGEQISDGIRRFNGWLYGAATVGAAICIPPFIESYQGKNWASERLLFALFSARCLVTGLATQPAWWLYGHGWMHSLAGHLRREYLVALALSVPLGLWLGPIGVAWAFLIATCAGVLLPLPLEYARRTGSSVARVLGDSWLRAAGSGVISILVAWAGLQAARTWPMIMVVAVLCVSVPLLAVFLQALWRMRLAGNNQLLNLVKHL